MFVKVYKLGEEDPVHNFSLGSHVIGRGPDLQCNDKRVSRNHASIKIAPDSVKLTSLHINPCFLKAANSTTITILSKDSTTSLNDGDAFAFLPEDYWFRIKIVEEDNTGTVLKNEIKSPEEGQKRPLDTSEDEIPPDKKTKTEESIRPVNDDVENKDVIIESAESNVQTDVTVANNNVTVEATECNVQTDVTVATTVDTNLQTGEADAVTNQQELVDNNCQGTMNEPAQNEEITSSQDIKQEVEDPPNEENASTSNPRPRRERCWYGAECYRKNAVHRQEYTHPGDSDFESDPDDNRPTCSYGATCYRKNKGHRRDYKHPPRQPPSKTKKKRIRKKVDHLNVADSEDMAGIEDLSDSEDPFLADDDSDDYVEDSDEDDTDWEDSQNVDEDSENLKRLVKEAKKFTK